MAVQLSLFDDLPVLQSASLPPPIARRLPAVSGNGRWPRHGDHNLLFAAVPPPRMRDEIARRWNALSGKLGSKQQFRQSTLHMSIYCLGSRPTLDARFVELFRDIADGIAFAPFELTFTRCESFGGGAIVLVPDNGRCGPLQDLAQTLRDGLSDAGLSVPSRLPVIRPHVTLSYGPVGAGHLIEPLKWTVNSFSLIDSICGYGIHNPLGVWPAR